jgi:hypothetical protein
MNAEHLMPDAPELGEVSVEVWTVDNLLRPEECASLIASASQSDWLTQTAELPGLPPRIQSANQSDPVGPRRSGADGFAVIDDDRLALRLFCRIQDELPRRLDDAELTGIKPMFRCLHYRPGAADTIQHDPTRAGARGEQSKLSLLLFLNDAFEGGEIDFMDGQTVIEPAVGRGVFFRHSLPYRNAPVQRGTKHLLRTEVFYNDRWKQLAEG